MRRLALIVCALAVISLHVGAQTPPRRSAPARRPPAADRLPVRRVTLYKNGIGYFEHLGRIRGSQSVAIDFNSSQLNDVLKTLTVLDLGSGRVTGVSYNSEAPLAQRMSSLHLALDEHATFDELLDALRGARLQVRAEKRIVNGRLLGVERQTRTRGGTTTTVDELTLVGDDGEIDVLAVTPSVTIKLLQRESTQQVDAFLSLLASSRAQDRRQLTIATAGAGARDLLVGYLSEVPIWKTTYRIVLSSKPGPTVLQAWAIVDNTIGEDWHDVQLSLMAGAPQSFIEALSQPLYASRPVVAPPRSLLTAPQTHKGTFESGDGGIHGRVVDPGNAALPGVTVKVLDAGGRVVAQAITDGRGQYTIGHLSPGRYGMSFELSGFRSSRKYDVAVEPGSATEENSELAVGALSEAVTVTSQKPETPPPGGIVGGGVSGIGGGRSSGPPMPSRDAIEGKIAETRSAAQGHDLGDLFEYRIESPISIAQNHSALVPILRAEVAADRVSLWNGRGSDRPLRSLWLTNSSGFTLDGGSFTVLDDGAFAGEGLIEPLKPGEKRLLSYAVDLGVEVAARNGDERRTVTRMSLSRGALVEHTEHVAQRVYAIHNSDTAERRVVIEHPIRAGWKLTSAVSPAESSTDAYRFVVTVPASKTETLTVTEQEPVDSTYRLINITDQQMDLFVRESGDASGLRTALAPIIAARAAVAALNADVNAHASEMRRMSDDQQRIRENMKVLKGSSEEQQLLKRYTSQLAGQEDRLDALRKESEDLERRRRDAMDELNRRIDAVSADIVVKAAPNP